MFCTGSLDAKYQQALSSIIPPTPFMVSNGTRYPLRVVGTIPVRYLYLYLLLREFGRSSLTQEEQRFSGGTGG